MQSRWSIVDPFGIETDFNITYLLGDKLHCTELERRHIHDSMYRLILHIGHILVLPVGSAVDIVIEYG